MGPAINISDDLVLVGRVNNPPNVHVHDSAESSRGASVAARLANGWTASDSCGKAMLWPMECKEIRYFLAFPPDIGVPGV